MAGLRERERVDPQKKATTDLFDALVYDTNDSDDAGLLVLLNASEPQVNELSSINPAIFVKSKAPFGKTPGGAFVLP